MPRRIAPVFLTVALAAIALSIPARAVQIGHVDDLPAAQGVNGWAGGSQFYANPGTGGVGGVGDGYLLVRNPNTGNLGTYNSSSEYFGDWTLTGATGVSFWLQQGETVENIQLHFAIGTPTDFWQLNTIFAPTANWTQFTVDFLTPANWTRIHGTGTFDQALHNVDRILFRHDLPPYSQNPNGVIGDFALDRVTILPAPGPCLLGFVGFYVASRRRR